MQGALELVGLLLTNSSISSQGLNFEYIVCHEISNIYKIFFYLKIAYMPTNELITFTDEKRNLLLPV